MARPLEVYRIVHRKEWAAARAEGVYRGSDLDARDGFLHLSFAHQVADTLAAHFAGVEDLQLLELDAGSLGEALKYERSRGGDTFPHLHAELVVAQVKRSWPLPLRDGVHVLPAALHE